jgi:predicted HTH transcriptional regulator
MGTGMDRIHDALKDEHCPPVDIRYNTMFTLEFKRPTYLKQKDSEETRVKTPGKTPLQILEILKEQPALSIPEIAKLINKSDSATQRAIRKLREFGLITRIGPDKGGYWQVLNKENE